MPRPIFVDAGAVGASGAQTSLSDTIEIPESGLWQILLSTTAIRETTAVSSMTIDGEAMTLKVAQNNYNNNGRVELWYKTLPPRGAGLTLQANWGSNVKPAMSWALLKSVYISDPFRYSESSSNHWVQPSDYDWTMTNGDNGDLALDFIVYWDNGYLSTPLVNLTGLIHTAGVWHTDPTLAQRVYSAISRRNGDDNGARFVRSSAADFFDVGYIGISLRGIARSGAQAVWFG